MEMIDGLLMFAGDFGAFVRRRVLPPGGVLDEFDRYAPERWTRSFLGCGAGILTHDGLTMTRPVRAFEALR